MQQLNVFGHLFEGGENWVVPLNYWNEISNCGSHWFIFNKSAACNGSLSSWVDRLVNPLKSYFNLKLKSILTNSFSGEYLGGILF